MNRELPDVQAGFRKGRGTRDQIANILWIIEKAREFQKNIYFCFIDYGQSLWYVDHNNCGKFLKRKEYETTLPASWKIYMQVKKQQLELDMSPFLFNLYAEYIMRNPGWKKHKLESRLPGEISVTSDMQMTPPLW